MPAAMTHKMTMYLPMDLAERLRVAAFERRVSQAEIVRNAVERELRRLERSDAR